MPSAETILGTAAAIANDWRTLAMAWHVLLGALLLALLGGWRPSNRVIGYLLVAPLLSVSALAWAAGNPFNGTVFALLAFCLAGLAIGLSIEPVQVAPPQLMVPGMLLVAFGWTYPHFLNAESWTAYVYATPFGLLPCPTLSTAIGVTLVFGVLRSAPWGTVLAVAGITYGAIGVFSLGVTLDYGLLAGATVLGAAVVSESTMWRSVRADRDERTRRLPGDDLIPKPIATLTHAVTIRRPPHDVWPWLAQMGAGNRAGWYSYDFIDNGRRPSGRRIVPELQHLTIGTIFPAIPGATDGFTLLAFEPERFLVLGASSADGAPLVTWAFVLEEAEQSSTRLVVRARGGSGYRISWLPLCLTTRVIPLVHFIMQRKQLLGIATRAERTSASNVVAGAPTPAARKDAA